MEVVAWKPVPAIFEYLQLITVANITTPTIHIYTSQFRITNSLITQVHVSELWEEVRWTWGEENKSQTQIGRAIYDTWVDDMFYPFQLRYFRCFWPWLCVCWLAACPKRQWGRKSPYHPTPEEPVHMQVIITRKITMIWICGGNIITSNNYWIDQTSRNLHMKNLF